MTPWFQVRGRHPHPLDEPSAGSPAPCPGLNEDSMTAPAGKKPLWALVGFSTQNAYLEMFSCLSRPTPQSHLLREALAHTVSWRIGTSPPSLGTPWGPACPLWKVFKINTDGLKGSGMCLGTGSGPRMES